MSQYLKHVKTGRVFLATKELAKHPEMQPCEGPKAATKVEPRKDEATPVNEQATTDTAANEERFGLDIDNATKDQLESYAKARFDVDLDKRKSVGTLREQVRELLANEA